MSTVESMIQAHPRGSHSRLLFHAAWGLAAASFLSVGLMAMRSLDPHGPVSVLVHGNAPLMMLEVLALAAVTSAIATVLAGQDYPDVGAFAVGIGLALVSLRGDNMTYLLMEKGTSRNLCLLLVAEGLFWSVAMALTLFASALTVRWVGVAHLFRGGVLDREHRIVQPRSEAERDRGGSVKGHPALRSSSGLTTAMILSRMAAPAAPGLGRLWLDDAACKERRQWRTGLKHLAVAALVSLILIAVFSAGSGTRTIRHGQACFAVAAAFYLGVGRAQAYFPMPSTFWSFCSVPVVCVAAYSFSWLMSFRSMLVGDLVTLPASGFLRILPITYIAVGSSAALLAHWRSWHRHAVRQYEDGPSL